MGIIRLLLLIVLAVLVYKIVTTIKTPMIRTGREGNPRDKTQTLIQCATCGTWIAPQGTINQGGKNYCGGECRDKGVQG